MNKTKKISPHRVTIKDIAAMAGVSIGTVDRVLHNRGEVNEETHVRVMAFVEELCYTPNLLAKSLALKRSFAIAVLIPDAGNNNYYWQKPLAGFQDASRELNDFSTKIEVFTFDPGEESSFIKMFRKILVMHPDGFILAPNFYEAAMNLMPECKKRNIPLMFIDDNIEGQGLASFGQDALQSGIVAARLMDHSLPRKATVLALNFAGNIAITRHMQRREKGFMDYFQNRMAAGEIRTLSTTIDLSLKNEPSVTLKKLLSANSNVAGIFVTNSRVYKVAEFLASEKRKQLMLIGYDLLGLNIEFMEKGIIDYLICQKPEDQGYKSAMAMFNYLLNGKLIEKINYSPIDIIVKENIHYYNNINR